MRTEMQVDHAKGRRTAVPSERRVAWHLLQRVGARGAVRGEGGLHGGGRGGLQGAREAGAAQEPVRSGARGSAETARVPPDC